MDGLFIQILNMSIISSYVILFVILIRFLLKRAPKLYSYSLWSVVLLRLIIPFSFESIFSLIRVNPQAISSDIIFAQTPQINSGIGAIDNIVNNTLPAATTTASVNPIQIWIGIGQVIWLVGIASLVLYSIITTIKLSKRLRLSTHVSDNIYKADHITTPFVFGLIRPKIYLPANLSQNEKSYIIKHEQTHIERYDHIIKFMAFIVVSIHWFNPIVWLAFILMSKDMELSCDEKVIKELGNEIKKDYSNSLLSLSLGRRIIGGSPLAFGENNTKGRIKNILNYKKPRFWVTLIAIILIIGAAVGLLSNPLKSEDIKGLDVLSLPDKMLESEEEDINYNIISEYMKERSIATFSPYYELLDFQISNYNELEVDGNVEATFFYKIIEKNYDKDPDTVGYIKEAKESGNKNYQQMYDEYLQPREMNFDLKIIIQKDNSITLYSNVDPKGIEWEETEMSDFILSD